MATTGKPADYPTKQSPIITNITDDPEQLFTPLGKLGEGSYGSVYKAMDKRKGELVALKIVPIDNDLDELFKEISVLNGCEHPAIVRCFGSYVKDDHLWILIEYCAGGSVSDIIKRLHCVMEEREIAAIIRGALEGLAYLHERRKIHRDIKAGNILLNSKGEAKLADFGVAGQLSETFRKRKTVIGTPFWMAPEIIQEVGYGCEADIWSLGITCIEMAEGKPPFYNIHPMRAIFVIPTKPPATLQQPDRFSPEFNQFIARCLTKDPKLRPSASDLLKDPFIVNASKSAPPSLLEKIQSMMELANSAAANNPNDNPDDEEEINENNEESGTIKGTPGARGTVKQSTFSGTVIYHDQTGQPSKTGTVLKPKQNEASSSDGGTMNTMIVKDTLPSTPVRSSSIAPGPAVDEKVGTIKPFLNLGQTGTIKPQNNATRAVIEHQASPVTPLLPPEPEGNAKMKTIKQNVANSNAIIQEPGSEPVSGPSSAVIQQHELDDLLKELELNMEKELMQIKLKYESKRAPLLKALNQKRGQLSATTINVNDI